MEDERMEDVPLSDWALWRRGGHRRLVVAFSGVDQPAGRHAYYKTFDGQVDSLLLNCPDNGWFFEGVPMDGRQETSLAATLDAIGRLAADYEQVFFIGGSMGAYGALLYGYHFPGCHILAMGPEINPGIRTGYFRQKARTRALPLALSHAFASGDFKPWIVVGEKKYSDLFLLGEIQPARTVTVRNSLHQVPSVLHRHFSGLDKVLGFLVEGTLERELGALAGVMKQWPEVASFLYLMEIGRIPLRRACDYHALLPEDLYLRGYLALLIALRFEKTGNRMMALNYAARARDVNPGDLETHFVHDKLWMEIHGHAPTPLWRRYDSPLFDGVPLYEQWRSALREIHG